MESNLDIRTTVQSVFMYKEANKKQNHLSFFCFDLAYFVMKTITIYAKFSKKRHKKSPHFKCASFQEIQIMHTDFRRNMSH